MSKRMTKQVRTMVEEVNDHLKRDHVKDIGDAQFVIMQHLLIRAGCYSGFNYFTVDGRLSGGDNEKFDHLELYIF